MSTAMTDKEIDMFTEVLLDGFRKIKPLFTADDY